MLPSCSGFAAPAAAGLLLAAGWLFNGANAQVYKIDNDGKFLPIKHGDVLLHTHGCL